MQRFAVFDIDGTLIRWQLYHAVVNELAKRDLLGKDALQHSHEARMHWKRREGKDAFREYELELIKIYEAALPALKTEDFDACVDAVIDEYKDQTYTYTRDLLETLKRGGYYLLAISGSHKELVEKIGNYYGFDHCVGTDYERSADKFSGEKFVASHHKEALLKEEIESHNLDVSDSYAVGDSASDAPMLEVASNPIAFNPDQALLDIAKKNGWPIVVERKNVVYKLEPEDGSYVLA